MALHACFVVSSGSLWIFSAHLSHHRSLFARTLHALLSLPNANANAPPASAQSEKKNEKLRRTPRASRRHLVLLGSALLGDGLDLETCRRQRRDRQSARQGRRQRTEGRGERECVYPLAGSLATKRLEGHDGRFRRACLHRDHVCMMWVWRQTETEKAEKGLARQGELPGKELKRLGFQTVYAPGGRDWESFSAFSGSEMERV